MLCPYCGHNIENDSRFCRFCGRPIQAERPQRSAAFPAYMWVLLPLTLAACAVVVFLFYRWVRNHPDNIAIIGTPSQTVMTPSVLANTAEPTYTASPEPSLVPTNTASSSEPALTPADMTSPSETPPSYVPPPTETMVPTATMVPPTPEPTDTPTPLPPCPLTTTVAVDPAFGTLSKGAELGCPLGPAQVVWAAWQPFQHGYMLWREDTGEITVFFKDNETQMTVPDQWDGQKYHTDEPPEGKMAPKRGFGWIWTQDPKVAERLGWASDEEKGLCIRLQLYQAGFVFRSSTDPCNELLNRAIEANLRSLLVEVLSSGPWMRH